MSFYHLTTDLHSMYRNIRDIVNNYHFFVRRRIYFLQIRIEISKIKKVILGVIFDHAIRSLHIESFSTVK